MADHDLVVENQLFPAVRGDINSALLALASNFSGSTPPVNPQAGMIWRDTAQALKALKIYDGTDWIALGVIDEVNNRFTPAGAVAGGVYATAGGTADVITLTIDYPYTAYRSGMTAVFKVLATNTGPATLNINGLGPKPVKRLGGSNDLQAGDLAAGAIAFLVYDLVQDTWQLLNASFSQGAASETASGAIEIATDAEVAAGNDNQRAVPPKKLAARVSGPFAIVASENNMNVETGLRYNIEVTGSVDIFGFVAASAIGIERRCFFAGAPMLRNSPSFQLAAGGDMQMASGDVATFVSVSSGWKMVNFLPVSGRPLKLDYPAITLEAAEDHIIVLENDNGLSPGRVAISALIAALVTQPAGNTGTSLFKTNTTFLRELFRMGAVSINFTWDGTGGSAQPIKSLTNASGNFTVNGDKLDCSLAVSFGRAEEPVTPP